MSNYKSAPVYSVLSAFSCWEVAENRILFGALQDFHVIICVVFSTAYYLTKRMTRNILEFQLLQMLSLLESYWNSFLKFDLS